MDIDEREIYLFLKSYGETFVAAREICRRAGGRKRYDKDHDWAKPILVVMAERGILETNPEGQYRVKPVKNKKGDRNLSPDIAKILREGGIKLEGEGETGSDEFYEHL